MLIRPEIWGRCPTCERWFYCAGWFDRRAPEPRCPGCGVAPTRIENRAVRSRIRIDDGPARLRVRGTGHAARHRATALTGKPGR